jgi:glycine/D-amino acid oxidase-like deaminating enzyme
MTALRLAERGLDVILLEAATPGSGTSGTTFAHVNASYPGYWDYFELRAAGVAGYRRLRSELGSAPWFVDTGFLQVEESPQKRAELSEHAARLRAAGYAVTRVSAERARDLQPDVVIGGEAEEAFFYPGEGYVKIHAMLADLLRAGTRLGLAVRPGQRVGGFQTEGDTIRGVILQSGERIVADVVVCCCGRWTDAVLALTGINLSFLAPDVPGSTAPGLIVVSSPVNSGLKRVVCVNGLNVRPDGGGRLMLWSGDLDARVQAQGARGLSGPWPPLPQELPRKAVEIGSRYVPALRAGAGVEKAYVCVRALPADGLPVAGWAPQADGLYVIVAHAAVTLAPILGELAAAEIAGLRDEPLLERFRPGRSAPHAHRPALGLPHDRADDMTIGRTSKPGVPVRAGNPLLVSYRRSSGADPESGVAYEAMPKGPPAKEMTMSVDQGIWSATW